MTRPQLFKRKNISKEVLKRFTFIMQYCELKVKKFCALYCFSFLKDILIMEA